MDLEICLIDIPDAASVILGFGDPEAHLILKPKSQISLLTTAGAEVAAPGDDRGTPYDLARPNLSLCSCTCMSMYIYIYVCICTYENI